MTSLCQKYFKKEMEAMENPGLPVGLYRAVNSDVKEEDEEKDSDWEQEGLDPSSNRAALSSLTEPDE
jgi:hypothetical protein